ncbi:MAG: hypothetical protein NC485_07430 [Ruminococcus flavefaciens]|nr:hypothetical protein [Ruminococcus flavefaciens]MCM1061605.1 hypothetical protein [Eubacterium sp.]
MEFQKKCANFSFGGGSVKTAGTGSLNKAVDAPAVETKKVCDKKVILKSAANAVLLSAVVILKHKSKNRKK